MISFLSLRLSASCVHVPVLLHAPVAMKPGMSSCLSGEDDMIMTLLLSLYYLVSKNNQKAQGSIDGGICCRVQVA